MGDHYGHNTLNGRTSIGPLQLKGKCKRCHKSFTKKSMLSIDREFCGKCLDYLANQEAEYHTRRVREQDDLDWINQ